MKKALDEFLKKVEIEIKNQKESTIEMEKKYKEMLSMKSEVEKWTEEIEKKSKDFELSIEKRLSYFIKSYEEWEKFAKEVRENFEKAKGIILGFDEKLSSFEKEFKEFLEKKGEEVERNLGEVKVIQDQIYRIGEKLNELEDKKFMLENELKGEIENIKDRFEEELSETRKIYIDARFKEILERIVDLESKVLALEKLLEEVKGEQTIIIE
ncbi:MAG: hypothetical protein QW140_02520 [Candidatus Aenigmatarchaeota archaeon]